MNKLPIEGTDLAIAVPENGVLRVAGMIRSPHQLIVINWIVDGCSGSSHCQAWRGQYEIDALVRAGYRIVSVSI